MIDALYPHEFALASTHLDFQKVINTLRIDSDIVCEVVDLRVWTSSC